MPDALFSPVGEPVRTRGWPALSIAFNGVRYSVNDVDFGRLTRDAEAVSSRRTNQSDQPRSDVDRLRHFMRVVDDCWDRRALSEGTMFGKVTSYSDGRGVTVEVPVADEDDIRALATSFRKLMAPGDDAQFERACNTTWTLVDDDKIREWTATNRESWKSIMAGESSWFAYVADGYKLQGRTMVDAWMNGVVFHSDPGTGALFERMNDATRALCILEVNGVMLDGARCAQAQRNVIQQAFDGGLIVDTT